MIPARQAMGSNHRTIECPNLVSRPRSIGSPAPIHPTLPARTHPLQRELGARSHRSYRSGCGVSASAKFGCRLQTQPHQPSCRLAPTLVASRHRSAHPKTGAPAHGQRIHTSNHPPLLIGFGCGMKILLKNDDKILLFNMPTFNICVP